MHNFRWKWIGYYVISNLLLAAGHFVLMWAVLQAQEIEVAAAEFFAFALAAAAGTFILAVIFGYEFSKSLHSKLQDITAGVKTLAYGDLSFRLPFTEDRDLGDIALAFNEMADRIDAQVSSLQKLAQENEQLIQQAKSVAIIEERQRLAQELHDAVSQQLFSIALTSATAAKIFDQDPQRASMLLRQIEQSANKAQGEMRALLLQLRPQTLENQPLVEAIRSLADELMAKMPIKCHLTLADLSLPAHVENHLYRIFQEGLANVLRHSHASQVEIRLESFENNSRVRLAIEDNGIGFSEEDISQTSFGIRTIRERVNELGGTAEWISVPGKGTRLEVRIPVRK
ncbi:MAG: sensor histidine kinase [Firmicutes bacterium]|jgi:NarL family two-component system sensor histidine kinase LiaS|nr:sensor histidine kinase [Bacillota bacterium]NLL89103.1 sensor histidine kinase [Bacillota bacterium]